MGASDYRLRVLGGFALEGPSGASAPPLPQRRAEAVLAVLAVCGDLGCTRERLLALLWPESDEAHARHGLRDALHAIRHALGPGAVLSAGDLLRLDSSVVASDVLSFAQALRSGRQADAVRAYAGPLLDGFHVDDAPEFERWLDGERTRLARHYAEALERLATAAEGAGAWGEAASWWAQAEEHDPLNSHLVLRHVEALATIGDRANAIKFADAHVRRLREELELEPDRDVLARIERIRRGEVPAPRGGAPRRPIRGRRRTGRRRPTGRGRSGPPAAPGAGSAFSRAACSGGAATNAPLGALAGGGRGGRPGRRRDRRRPPAEHPSREDAPSAHRESPCCRSRTSAPTRPTRIWPAGCTRSCSTQLAKVGALTVIGRTSVLSYAGSTKRLSQIGDELGVGSIVEGSVQVVGNRLRVNVQLIDPATEAHLWAERYDRTLDDAFAVQSDIAQRIVAAVGATLTSAEAKAITAPPTRNDEAYQLYLQGLDYYRRPGYLRQNLEIARNLYERALALDSTFALAHLGLASVHWWSGAYDPSGAGPGLYHRELAAALRFVPQLPQARLAVIMEPFWRLHDYRATLNELGPLVRRAPNDGELWGTLSAAVCRVGALGQRGRGVRARESPRPAQRESLPGSGGRPQVPPALQRCHRGVPSRAPARAGLHQRAHPARLDLLGCGRARWTASAPSSAGCPTWIRGRRPGPGPSSPSCCCSTGDRTPCSRCSAPVQGSSPIRPRTCPARCSPRGPTA